jgi:protein TonB
MNSLSLGYFDLPRLHRQGWVYSIVFHTVIGAGALALVSGISPTYKPDSFEWNVALLESTNAQPTVESLHKTTPDSPPKPQPVKSRLTPPEPTAKPVHHTTKVTPVHQTASTVFTEPDPYREVSQVTAPVTPEERTLDEEPVPVNDRAPREAVTPTEEPLVSQLTTDSPVQQPQVETISEPMPTQQPSTDHLMASAAPVKADYGWLMRALLGRIDELKNYPVMARMNRWEGKVILRAVIKDDGQVLMVDVQESSGRAILDNDAMETLKKASPLKLDHPLGKPQVAILMPISYSLR